MAILSEHPGEDSGSTGSWRGFRAFMLSGFDPNGERQMWTYPSTSILPKSSVGPERNMKLRHHRSQSRPDVRIK